MPTVVRIRVTNGSNSELFELPCGGTRGEVSIDHLLFDLRRVLDAMRAFLAEVDVTIVARTNEVDLLAARLRRRLPADETQAGRGVLTEREIEVLDLIMKGLTNKEIARQLFISFETAKSHRRHILEKTGVRNTAALVSHFHNVFADRGDR